MKPQALLYSLVSIVLLIGLPAGAPAQVRQTSDQSAKPILSNAKFEIARNLIFVRARLNNSEPLWFILDSGASVSVVNKKLANSLGLKIGDKKKINATGGIIEYSLVKDVDFDVFGAKLSNQTVAAIDLSVLEPSFGRKIDGILGAEFFSRYVVEIDYAAQALNLYDPAGFRYSGAGEVIEFEIESNTPFIHADLSPNGMDFTEGSFLVDTGAISSLYINKPFEEKHGFIRSLEKTIPEPFTSHLGGELGGRVGQMKKMRVGKFTVENAITHFFEPVRASSGNSASTRDGIIGGGFFKKFTIILDYSRKQLILEPNQNLFAPFEFDQSGLDLVAVGTDFKTIKVRKALENSPASEAGLRAEDIIVSIDGKAASGLGLNSIEEMFNQPGRQYELVVSRGREQLTTIIKLRNLI